MTIKSSKDVTNDKLPRCTQFKKLTSYGLKFGVQ